MKNLNALVEKEWGTNIIGKYRFGSCNTFREKMDSLMDIEWPNNNQVYPSYLWTWRIPGGDTENHRDYITISKRFRNAVLHSETFQLIMPFRN